MAALTLGLASCGQESDPKYNAPTTFTVATPALQNQEFLCASEMTDPETFNLFCTQPDYGYSAVCEYSAIVSLDPECPTEDLQAVTGKSYALENTLPSSAAMAIKTFELGVAVNQLLGVTDKEDFDAKGYGNQTFKCYFRAVCEIPGIEGSRIVSDNVVSYNLVRIQYAEKKPAWIYIVGNVQNPETGVVDDFKGPSVANYDHYYNNFRMEEPANMIGQKLYVGQFNINPKSATPDLNNVDDTSQFRFFTELLGWSTEASLSSAEGDFYVLPIADKFDAGYSGDVVAHGLGNWGVWVSELTPMTVVVDQVNLKIYVKEGFHDVTFVGRDPEFN